MSVLTNLLEECRTEMNRLERNGFGELVKESTPVLFFGELLKAEVVTVGYNPSSQEFNCRGCGRRMNRLSFFEPGDLERPISADKAAEVIDNMTNYFRHNPYHDWFDHWDGGIANRDYYDGTAAHTDIISPFSTIRNLSELKLSESRETELLWEFGLQLWSKVMMHAREVKLVIGIGPKTLKQMQRIGELNEVKTRLDGLGGNTTVKRPFFYSGHISLPDGRKIKAVVWKPYRNTPLTWLSGENLSYFNALCLKHERGQ